MKLKNIFYNDFGYKLTYSKTPLFVTIGISLISKNHAYIDKKFINFKTISSLIKNPQKTLVTGTGVLLIFYEEYIIKYPLGVQAKKSLENEYKNYLILKKSNFSNLIEYNLEKKDNYYIMDKLFPIDEPIKVHKQISLYLNNYASKVELQKLINNDIIFNNAFKHIKNACPSSNKKEIINLLEKNTTKIVPIHGDFTQHNMMKNKNEKIVLIDLDRFSLIGIEKFDRIHFAMEYYAKKRQDDFFGLLDMLLLNNTISTKSFNSLYIYFIYRLGLEYNNDVKLPLSYQNNICKLVGKFLFVAKKRELRNEY